MSNEGWIRIKLCSNDYRIIKLGDVEQVHFNGIGWEVLVSVVGDHLDWYTTDGIVKMNPFEFGV